jgi:hypothetical protein
VSRTQTRQVAARVSDVLRDVVDEWAPFRDDQVAPEGELSSSDEEEDDDDDDADDDDDDDTDGIVHPDGIGAVEAGVVAAAVADFVAALLNGLVELNVE